MRESRLRRAGLSHGRAQVKGAYHAWITMGLGGLFISTNYPPQVGTTIRVLFDVDHGEVRARAVVRSVLARRGMGIEIIAMQPDDRARLSRWLELLPAHSQPSEQEDSSRKRRFERITLPKGIWAAWHRRVVRQTSGIRSLGMADIIVTLHKFT